MGIYRPDDFKVSDEGNDIWEKLPDIKSHRRNYLAFEYLPHKKYFNPSESNRSMSGRGSKGRNKSGIPRPKKQKESKTARVGTPSELPNLNSYRRHSQISSSRPSNPSNSISFYKPHLDITNDDLLEKAYKNILPTEEKMLENEIEIRRSRPTSSRRPSQPRSKNKNFFKNRFKSLEGNTSVEIGGEERVTPMQRRQKNKQKKKTKKKVKR